jgi:hypothetical protein
MRNLIFSNLLRRTYCDNFTTTFDLSAIFRGYATLSNGFMKVFVNDSTIMYIGVIADIYIYIMIFNESRKSDYMKVLGIFLFFKASLYTIFTFKYTVEMGLFPIWSSLGLLMVSCAISSLFAAYLLSSAIEVKNMKKILAKFV